MYYIHRYIVFFIKFSLMYHIFWVDLNTKFQPSFSELTFSELSRPACNLWKFFLAICRLRVRFLLLKYRIYYGGFLAWRIRHASPRCLRSLLWGKQRFVGEVSEILGKETRWSFTFLREFSTLQSIHRSREEFTVSFSGVFTGLTLPVYN